MSNQVCVYTTKTFIDEKPYKLRVDAPEFIRVWRGWGFDMMP
jgi:hypothetical protein